MHSLHLKLNGVDVTSDRKVIERCYTLIEMLGLNVRKATHHRFYPYGLTFSAIFAESHGTVSTWPEKRTLQLDLFVCCENGLGIATRAVTMAVEIFGATSYSSAILERDSMSISGLDSREGGDSDVRLRTA